MVRPNRWSTLEWERASSLLYARSRARCEVCGHRLLARVERHHRQRRAVGGDRLANLLYLHSDCHAWLHAHPVEARAGGWIVSAYGDPATTPVRLWSKALVLLDDSGGFTEPASVKPVPTCDDAAPPSTVVPPT
jgi:hypothetical protein